MELFLKLIGKVNKRLVYLKFECVYCNCININEWKLWFENFVCFNLIVFIVGFVFWRWYLIILIFYLKYINVLMLVVVNNKIENCFRLKESE